MPTRTPSANGTAMPASDAVTAGRPTRRTRRRSVSMPVRRRSMSTPSWATALSIPFWPGRSGNRAACPAGHMRPKKVGPRSTPASNWPMTAGWPIRCIASPARRPADDEHENLREEQRLGRRLAGRRRGERGDCPADGDGRGRADEQACRASSSHQGVCGPLARRRGLHGIHWRIHSRSAAAGASGRQFEQWAGREMFFSAKGRAALALLKEPGSAGSPS